LGQHGVITGVAAVYPGLFTFSLLLLWLYPLALLRISEVLAVVSAAPKVNKVVGVGEAVFVFGLFRHHPRVLDAWVAKYLAKAREQFQSIATVEQREVHVSEVPVELDRKVVPALTTNDLKEAFARNRAFLLIWGEGGAGKTSIACHIARSGMSEDDALRPCAHRMLPVMIEQDLNLEVGKGREVLTEVIRGQLKELTGEDEAPSQELARHLLKRKRVLLIVDGLSELNQATRNKVRPIDPEFAANALIVTSRLEETLDGVTKTTLHPMRIQGNRLSSFMEAYLLQRGKRALFDDAEFFNGCGKLSVMVGDRDTTVLLAKLYAEQMIASKEGAGETLPENIPDLMLQYLNELNRREAGLDNPAVHSTAKTIAWECMKETFRPTPARIEVVLGSLGGDAAQDRINYLEKKLRFVQVIGAGEDRVKFALDPLAEYLAGLYLVEHYRDNEQMWREFLAKVDAAPGAPEAVKGFLLAARDCCIAKGPEEHVPSFVADELAKRAGLDPEAVKNAQLEQRVRRLIVGLTVPEAIDRMSAAEALGRMGAEAKPAVPHLTKLVKDEDEMVAASAARALGGIGSEAKAAVPVLVDAINEKHWRVSEAAIVALGGIGAGAEAGVPALMDVLQHWAPDYQEAAAKSVGRIGPPAREAIPELTKALLHSNPGVRISAAVALWTVTSDASLAVPALAQALSSSDRTHRMRATHELVRIGPAARAAVAALMNALRDGETDIRSAASRALGAVGADAELAVPALLELLNDAESPVRSAAAWALGKIALQDGTVVGRLVERVKDAREDAGVRCDAAMSLARIGHLPESVVQAIIDGAKDQNGIVKDGMLLALGEIGKKFEAYVPALIEALADNAGSVRRRAAEMLGEIGAEACPAADALQRSCEDPEAYVRMAAEKALQRISPVEKTKVVG